MLFRSAVPVVSEAISYLPEVGHTLALSADGTTLVMGAPYTDNGAVFVFYYDVETELWTQQAGPLVPQESMGAYGISVGVSGDGHTLVFGGFLANDTGTVYVYDRDPETLVWYEQEFTLMQETENILYQGQKVAVSADGDRKSTRLNSSHT